MEAAIVLPKKSIELKDQIRRGFCFTCQDSSEFPRCSQRALRIAETFLNKLPEIMEMLSDDVQAAYEGDPAAHSAGETIFCYPGVWAITNHRLAHELYCQGVPLIPRIISEHAHGVTGIDIHPGAKISNNFFIVISVLRGNFSQYW